MTPEKIRELVFRSYRHNVYLEIHEIFNIESLIFSSPTPIQEIGADKIFNKEIPEHFILLNNYARPSFCITSTTWEISMATYIGEINSIFSKKPNLRYSIKALEIIKSYEAVKNKMFFTAMEFEPETIKQTYLQKFLSTEFSLLKINPSLLSELILNQEKSYKGQPATSFYPYLSKEFERKDSIQSVIEYMIRNHINFDRRRLISSITYDWSSTYSYIKEKYSNPKIYKQFREKTLKYISEKKVSILMPIKNTLLDILLNKSVNQHGITLEPVKKHFLPNLQNSNGLTIQLDLYDEETSIHTPILLKNLKNKEFQRLLREGSLVIL